VFGLQNNEKSANQPYEKDVDGFHPLNTGRLSQRGREPLFVPCTPRGCIELLQRSGIEIAGKEAVVVGRSNVVGKVAHHSSRRVIAVRQNTVQLMTASMCPRVSM
jgi:5,10-methylene-tetrahydrofolate dehydrogenase/methenyl tetrahydrofolate cyclohydrolase